MSSRMALSVIGDLCVLHPDDPPEPVIRRRIALLLQAPLPARGWVRILPGVGPDEVCWQTMASWEEAPGLLGGRSGPVRTAPGFRTKTDF